MNNNEKKIKVIISIHSELTQRWLDYFCLDTLNEHFDLEYWDCSDFVKPSFHFTQHVERPYVKKIKSLDDFKRNLDRIPRHSVVCDDVHLIQYNYQYHQLLSSYFPKIVYVNFFTTTQSTPSMVDKEKKQSTITRVIKTIKSAVFKNKYIRFACKYISHRGAAEREKLLADFKADAIWAMYQHYIVSSKPGTKYFINHPNVEEYIKYRNLKVEDSNRYMVYIDQYFPYHNDLRKEYTIEYINHLAEGFYPSINTFFDKVEKKYNCRIIIAAHPLSDYHENPYGGRDLFIGKTAELISKSIGTIGHYSGAIDYALLFKKPLAIIYNQQVEQMPSFYNFTIKKSIQFGLDALDIDHQDDFEIKALSDDIYNNYIHHFFGELNEEDIIPNSELLVRHLTSIWHEMYDNI